MDCCKKALPYFLGIIRSLCKHSCIALTYIVVKYLFFFFSPKYTAEERFLWQFLLISAVYLSTAFAFSLYNKRQFYSFEAKKSKDVFSGLLSFDFLIDLVGSALFFLCFSIELKSFWVVVFAILSNILTFIFAKRVWLGIVSSKGPTRLFLIKLIVHLFLAVPGLFILFFLAASIIPSLDTLLMVSKLLSYTLIFPVVISIFLYIRALGQMRKFLKKLYKFCADKNIKKPSIKNPYLSVFKVCSDNTFKIEIHGKVYECYLLSFTNIFRPVIFKSDGYFYRISARALKRNEKPTFFFETSYSFDSSCSKVIIITSAPYVVKLQEGTLTKTFDTGDMCGGYKLFTPPGFFGAAERNTISRKTYD